MSSVVDTCATFGGNCAKIPEQFVQAGIQVAFHFQHQTLRTRETSRRRLILDARHSGQAISTANHRESTMKSLANAFILDEAGFVVSAELILVATIAVLSLVVGLSELANGINQELEDVGTAFAKINQSYRYNGLCGHKGHWSGSKFNDNNDECDSEHDIVCHSQPMPEGSHARY
jgi:hypothetical protein